MTAKPRLRYDSRGWWCIRSICDRPFRFGPYPSFDEAMKVFGCSRR